MADPNLAFDPNVPPFDLGSIGTPPPAPRAAPTPGVTPQQQQPQGPAPQTYGAWLYPYDYETEYKSKTDQDYAISRQKPVSYVTGDPIQDYVPKAYGDDPRIKHLNEMEMLLKDMTRQERAPRQTALRAERARIQKEIDDENRRGQHDTDRRRAEHFSGSGIRPQNPTQLEQDSKTVATFVENQRKQLLPQGAPDPNKIDYKTGQPVKVDANDPKQRQEREYQYNSSVFGTMNPQHLRDTVHNVIQLNPGLSPEMALSYVVRTGQPVDVRKGHDATGENGQRGKAGANYGVVGYDKYRPNLVVIRMSDGRDLRMDRVHFDRLVKARSIGFDAQHEYLGKLNREREAYKAPGPVEEHVLKPAVKFMEDMRERLR